MKKYLSVLLLAFLGSGLMLVSYHTFFNKKIGYVRTGLVFEQYAGAIEANALLGQEAELVQHNIDTLEKRFVHIQAKAEKDKEDAYMASLAEEQLKSYRQVALGQLERRQNEASVELIAVINDAIQSYGKEKDYSLILGATSSGNILYAEDADDLTERIIEKMNADYKKKKGEK
jgi:outer membrane protein